MADVQVIFGTSIRDADGDRKSLEIAAKVVDTTTLASLQTWVTGTQDFIDLVTEGEIVETTCTIKFTNSGTNKSAAVAGSDVEEGGLVQFSVTGTAYSHSHFIPAIIEAAKVGNNLNLAETNLDNYITRVTSAQNGVLPTNGYGMSLNEAIKGRKRFRK